jgi:hypothetical protein
MDCRGSPYAKSVNRGLIAGRRPTAGGQAACLGARLARPLPVPPRSTDARYPFVAPPARGIPRPDRKQVPTSALLYGQNLARPTYVGLRRRLGSMDVKRLRALAARCKALARVAVRDDVREQLRQWVHDFKAEAASAEPSVKARSRRWASKAAKVKRLSRSRRARPMRLASAARSAY